MTRGQIAEAQRLSCEWVETGDLCPLRIWPTPRICSLAYTLVPWCGG